MCAPSTLKMEPEQMSRFNSTSTSKTLVGSDEGFVSPGASPVPTIDRKLQMASPIVQTSDSKEWLDLDAVSPKLLRELRRQYDPDTDGEKGPLAKIKAWSRSTKRGFDIRLRRKLSPEQDEVTDFHLVMEDAQKSDIQRPPLLEMPADNAVFEMPDSSIVPELPGEPRVTQRHTDNHTDEPLPRYEPPPETRNQQRPRLTIEPVEPGEGSTLHRHSSSGSSIVSTPTDDLPIDRHKEHAVHVDAGDSDSAATRPNEISSAAAAVDGQELQDRGEKDELQRLLAALNDHLVKQAQDPASRDTGRLRLEKTVQYGTETDVEPPSPKQAAKKKRSVISKSTVQTSMQKPALLRPKPSILKRAASSRTKQPKDDPELEQISLPRRLTVPKKASKDAGAEAVWVKVLQTQGKILGAEDPLVFEGRHALALSRVNKHSNCSPSLLSALYRTQAVATQKLGDHPFVETFSADLETLRSLIVYDTDDGSASPPADPAIPVAVEDLRRPSAQPHQVGRSSLASPRSSPPAGPGRLPPPTIKTTFIPSTEDTQKASYDQQTPESNLWNTLRPPHQAKHGTIVLSGLILAGLATTLKRGISWLERTYGPEPPVEAGKVRVRWTCSCGDQLYDNFIERKPGAARALEAYLNRPRTRTGGGASPTTPSSASSRSFNGSFNSSMGGTASTQTSWSSYSGMSKDPSEGGTKRSQTTATLPQYTPFTPIGEPPWLLTCANEDRFAPKVSHLDMSPHKITSDKDLAKALREHYFDVNRKWWKRLKLRGLTTIEFVQFECHQNRFADIRKCPDMPPIGTDEYSFEPGEMMPPVGPKYLMHLFKHPEDYDSELITYLRAPKRSGRLQLGVGWGINLVEGFLADRVWLLVNALFAFASLAFGVAWACEKNDIQGAFGVAQWVCMLAVFVGGWIQACLG